MGEQDEEHSRSGYFYFGVLLLRTVYDTGCGVIDSSEVLPGTSYFCYWLFRSFNPASRKPSSIYMRT